SGRARAGSARRRDWRRVPCGAPRRGRASCLRDGGAPGLLLLPAEQQPVRRQRVLDFLDRLLAEVRDRAELRLRLGDEVADGLDPDALQAVVRAHAELEL